MTLALTDGRTHLSYEDVIFLVRPRPPTFPVHPSASVRLSLFKGGGFFPSSPDFHAPERVAAEGGRSLGGMGKSGGKLNRGFWASWDGG